MVLARNPPLRQPVPIDLHHEKSLEVETVEVQGVMVAEHRKARRYDLKLPLELMRAGSRRVSQMGETLNMSSGGVLFSEPGTPIEIGQPVEYMIRLPHGGRLRCVGKIVRRDAARQALAATLERYEFLQSGN
jgi:hypothetical protein